MTQDHYILSLKLMAQYFPLMSLAVVLLHNCCLRQSDIDVLTKTVTIMMPVLALAKRAPWWE